MKNHDGWIGVDLDGTLAFYDHWRGEDHIGPPIPAMLQRVKEWLGQGIDVRIVTARCYSPRCVENGFHIANMDRKEALEAIRLWCIFNIGQELPVQCNKDFGMIELWDDRCVQVEPNTGRRLDGAIS